MAPRRSGRVSIEHMRLEYRLAEPNSPERERIREINRALGRASVRGDGEVGASPLTAVRMRGSPVAWLLANRKIGGEEFSAADEIERAFMALSGGLMLRPINLERTSPGRRADWNERTAIAVERYRRFADHWSARAKQFSDKTLEIVIATVVDQRPFSVIEEDIGLRHGKARQVMIRGLRDYAARAGFVDGKTAARWKGEAEESFPATARLLSLAAAKARRG